MIGENAMFVLVFQWFDLSLLDLWQGRDVLDSDPGSTSRPSVASGTRIAAGKPSLYP